MIVTIWRELLENPFVCLCVNTITNINQHTASFRSLQWAKKKVGIDLGSTSK